MTLAEITENFFSELNPGNGELLYSQLHKQVGRLIEALPDRSEFPSERDLAGCLKINRNTLRRAITPYVESGLLRRSNKGTFVFKPGTEIRQEAKLDVSPHPLMLGAFPFASSAPVKVRVLLYENLPAQKQFWHETANEINRQERIAIEYLSPSSTSTSVNSYLDVVSELRPDIIQLPASRALLTDTLLDQLQPLSQEQRNEINTDRYRIRNFFQLDNHAADYAAPVYISPLMEAVNPVLMNQCYPDWEEYFSGGSIAPMLAGISERLPGGILLAYHYCGLMLHLRYPDAQDRPAVATMIRNMMEILRQLIDCGQNRLKRSYSQPFDWFQPDAERDFLNGHQLHHCLASFLAKMRLEQGLFKPVYALPGKTGPGMIMAPSMNLGLSRHCVSRSAAERFLHFLLEPFAQQRLAENIGVVPFLKAADEHFCRAFRLPAVSTQPLLNALREPPHLHYDRFWNGSRWQAANYISRLSSGITVEQVTQEAENDFFAN